MIGFEGVPIVDTIYNGEDKGSITYASLGKIETIQAHRKKVRFSRPNLA